MRVRKQQSRAAHPITAELERWAVVHARERIGARSQQSAGLALARRIGTAPAAAAQPTAPEQQRQPQPQRAPISLGTHDRAGKYRG